MRRQILYNCFSRVFANKTFIDLFMHFLRAPTESSHFG